MAEEIETILTTTEKTEGEKNLAKGKRGRPKAPKSASIPSKKGKVPVKEKTVRKAIDHPKVSSLVLNAVKSLSAKGGSSLKAIKKHITEEQKIDAEKMNLYIKKFLKKAVENGQLIQSKGKGCTGSFKLPIKGKSSQTNTKSTIKKPNIKKKMASSPKKTATKNPATSSPAKVSSPKKTTGKKTVSAKKPTVKKSVKKTISVQHKKAPTVSKKATSAAKTKPTTPAKASAKPASSSSAKTTVKKITKSKKTPIKKVAAKKIPVSRKK